VDIIQMFCSDLGDWFESMLEGSLRGGGAL
jgi:hypothetical protein